MEAASALSNHSCSWNGPERGRRRTGGDLRIQRGFGVDTRCPSINNLIAEKELLNQDLWACNDRWVEFFGDLILKWVLCFIIDVLSDYVGFFFNLAIENIAGVKFVVTSNMMLANRTCLAELKTESQEKGGNAVVVENVKVYGDPADYLWAFGVFAASNLVMTMFAAIITAFIAPEAAGSGIPEVKAYKLMLFLNVRSLSGR
ncbi:Putative chloride channel-like protein CLC-g [Dendrobium catenatum]|uniref:Chloride channel-like protein CLC-g n=1 Tax=Dendrobium catenatum TaxID=906689 RepID=A0A2I0WI77_9ASPA|nr:Putative chloride channel-like protein CLC-g [Dendrobium catenatum]